MQEADIVNFHTNKRGGQGAEANDSVVVAPEIINETAAVELTTPLPVSHDPFKEEHVLPEQLGDKLEARLPNLRQTLEKSIETPKDMDEQDIAKANPLRDGRELKGGSYERLLRQRDTAIKAELRQSFATTSAPVPLCSVQ